MNLCRDNLEGPIPCLMGVLIFGAISLALASEPNSQPKAPPVRSKDEWAVRRVDTLRNLQSVMGKLPEKSSAPLDLRILEEERVGGIKRQKITFVSEELAG